LDTARRNALNASRRVELKGSPCSVLDLTSPLEDEVQIKGVIDRDEPRLELETQIGIDSVIAVHDAISSPALTSKKSKSSATPAVDAGVEEKTEPVLKKGKK
jgi:hypothetical protein